MKILQSICIFLFILFGENDGSRILGIFQMGARSHYIVGSSLMKGLAAKGHDVTLIAPFVEKTPPKNFRSIELKDIMNYTTNEIHKNMVELRNKGVVESILEFYDMGVEMTRLTIEEKAVQKLLASNEKFDLIIMEVFLNEALLGLAQRFNAPVIGVSTFGASIWTTDLVGSPTPLSYVPNVFLASSDHMTLGQRIPNLLMGHFEKIFNDVFYLPKQAALYEKYFPKATADMYSVRRNVSLVLLNSHTSLSFPRPYTPNMIEVGGMNINRKSKKLPENMQKFLDSATDGAIYFSMGSNLKSKELPKEKLDVILNTFNSLKQKVLWKWEEPNLPGKGDNVFISDWFPQDDILSHPNVKLFITHGGLLSTTETIYHGVPVVGIPMFADQFLNMARAEAGGYGLTMDYNELSKEKFKQKITEVLNNNNYAKKIKDMSDRFRDQPMEPLQTAIYWVEYVIRHKGAPHLHCAGQDLSFIEYHNIDAFAIIYGVLLLVLYIIVKIFRILLALVVGSKKPKNISKKKKNN